MRYLITGAQGFIGRYLTAGVLKAEQDSVVYGLGRSPREDSFFAHNITVNGRRRQAPLPGEVTINQARYSYEQVDVTDEVRLSVCIERFCPDVVFHLASALRDDCAAQFQTSVAAAKALMSSLRGSASKVILSSTGGVYGVLAPSDLPARETVACRPVDDYAASKCVVESLCREEGRRLRVPVVSARIFNVVGAGQDERHVCGRFAAQISGRSSRIAVRNLETTRDFVDVRDVASGMILLAHAGESDGIYNLASGVETRIGEVLHAMLRLCNPEARPAINAEPGRANDVERHWGDISRLRALGFKCAYALERSLADVLGYYRRLSG